MPEVTVQNPIQRQQHRWEGAVGSPTLFSVARRKKGNKKKLEGVSKQKLLKGCNNGINITVSVILERLKFNNLIIVAENNFQCLMAPLL